MAQYRYACEILRGLNFIGEFSKNTRISTLNENPSSWSQVVACGRTDGQTATKNWPLASSATVSNLWTL